MSEKENEAPVAAGVRSRRQGSTSPEDLAAKEAAAQERQRASDARKESAKKAAGSAAATFKKHRIAWIVSGAVVVLLAVIGIVQFVSATSGSPSAIVDDYVEAMNAGDPNAFDNETLFPREKDVPLLPADVLKNVDTKLESPEIVIKDDVATITATNLSAPIVLELKNDVHFDGVLLKPHWSITTLLPKISIASAETLPQDAAISFGDYSIENASSPAYQELTAGAFSSPFGTLPLTVAATAATAKIETTVTITAPETAVTVGEGAVNRLSFDTCSDVAYPDVTNAFSSGTLDALAPMMSNPIRFGSYGAEWQEGAPESAVAFIQSSTKGAMDWNFCIPSATLTEWSANETSGQLVQPGMVIGMTPADGVILLSMTGDTITQVLWVPDAEMLEQQAAPVTEDSECPYPGEFNCGRPD